MCFEGAWVWPLTPLAICWISPPDFRKAAICALIDSLVSTAGAGLALDWEALTRMAVINLYKINTADHLIALGEKLPGEYALDSEAINFRNAIHLVEQSAN
jgi:hypothetical protein